MVNPASSKWQRIKTQVDEEMVQQLRASVTVSEDKSLDPKSYKVAL